MHRHSLSSHLSTVSAWHPAPGSPSSFPQYTRHPGALTPIPHSHPLHSSVSTTTNADRPSPACTLSRIEWPRF
ncbi:hypothetical protein FB451DRAFT_1551213 [Mycena latifolia]|nr:hypothetical protein FB451DRAFT_1551213 [Mycena latifolia]